MAQVIKKHIKDPGSAITHFIGMLMAIFAAVPLLIKAAHEPDRIYIISITVYAVSLILLYAASTTYHTFNRSEKINTILKKIDHMMISVLIAGSYTPICLLVTSTEDRPDPSRNRVGHCHRGHPDQGLLDQLPEMGILRLIHRHGLDLRAGVHPDPELHVTGGLWLAAGRRNHLHHRRRDLRSEASTLQQPT